MVQSNHPYLDIIDFINIYSERQEGMGHSTSIVDQRVDRAVVQAEDSQIPRAWQPVIRWIWLAVVLITGILFIFWLPATYTVFRSVCPRTACDMQLTAAQYQDLLSHGLPANFFAGFFIAIACLSAVISIGIAILIYTRKSTSWIGLLGSLSMVLFGVMTMGSNSHVILAFPFPWNRIGATLDYFGIVSFILFLFVFPNGQFQPRWSILPILLLVILSLPEYFIPGLPPAIDTWGWREATWLQMIARVTPLVTLIFVQAYRYRHVYSREQRVQVKWVVYGMTIAILVFLTLGLISILSPTLENHILVFMLSLGSLHLSLLLVPVTIGIAIVHHRLWDIDLIINRTLVYIPLTGILGGLYSSSIALFQRIYISTTGAKSDAAIILSTLILASTFTPIKNGLQGAVDKRFKGAGGQFLEIKALENQVKTVVEVLTIQNLARRLLMASVSAFQSSGGAVYLEKNGTWELLHSTGQWKEVSKLDLTIEAPGKQRVLLRLGPRLGTANYGSSEMQALQGVCNQIAEAIRLGE